MSFSEFQRLKEQYATLNTSELLGTFLKQFGQRMVMASSLSVEDQVLTHLILQADAKARIFVLDTGRLHQETYDVIAESMKRYGFQYEIYAPNTQSLEETVSRYGPNFFYESVDNRKLCCHIRKVDPLKRALADCDVWITGLRRDQSPTRRFVEPIEWDEAHQMIKLNPLATWTDTQVWTFIRDQNIPYNALHEKGFPSIGCAPCTRAIEAHEDPRAGRWWWESPEQKECGLHVVDGKLLRVVKSNDVPEKLPFE